MNEYLTLMELAERLDKQIGELLDLLALEGLLVFTPYEVDGYAYLVTEKGEKLVGSGCVEIGWDSVEVEKLVRKKELPKTQQLPRIRGGLLNGVWVWWRGWRDQSK